MVEEDNTTVFKPQEELIKHVLNDETFIIFYGGGIGGGKTDGGLISLFLYLQNWPGSKAHIIRESLPTLFRNLVPSYNNLTPVHPIQNQQQLQAPVKFSYGSELNFMAENYDADKELNRFRGLQTNIFLFDEGNECNAATFYKAIERVGRWKVKGLDKQPPPKIIITCNPSNNWVKDLGHDRWKKGTLPDGWVYIPALPFDNPHLPPVYLENLKNLPKKQYNTFVLGDWDSLKAENLFADEFDADRHVGQTKYNPDLPVILSFDFNVKNTCTVIQLQKRGVKVPQIRVLKEYNLAGGIESVCRIVKGEWKGARFLFAGDATGASKSGLTAGNAGYWKQIMAAFGYRIWDNRVFKVPKTNPFHKSSYLQMNVIFKHYDILIDAECIELINDLQQVQIVSKGDKMEIDKRDESRTHWLDTLRYMCNAYLPEAYDYVPESLRRAIAA